MIKMVLALSSENLFINEIGYVKLSGIQPEQVENTNLYKISAELLTSNKNFNTFVNNGVGKSESQTSPLYIPGLIKTNLGGSIKI